jgi:hypothetical protein
MTPDAKHKVEIGVAVLAFSAIVAICLYVWNQVTKISNACWAITGGAINNLSASSVDISLFISVKNISDFTIVLNSLDLDIYLNNTYVTHITVPVGTSIVSQETNVVSTNVQFAPEDLLNAGVGTIASILANESSVVIKTTGTASVTAGSVTASDVAITDEITLQQISDNASVPSKC